MPFALYSGIIVATIRAPCGDCNLLAVADMLQVSVLQFAPLAGTVTNAPLSVTRFLLLQFAPLAGTVTS